MEACAGLLRQYWCLRCNCADTGAVSSNPMFMMWHPICRYFVSPDQKQPTLRGAEHRRVVHLLSFAVCGILGAASGQWNHQVLTWAMCELAALVRDVFGPACLAEGVTVRRTRQLTDRLTTWMHRDFQGLFGPLHTPKLHRILAHVLEEPRLRGNLRDGDTGGNEAKHKGVKSAYNRTNRGRSLQLLMAEQVADVLKWAVHDNDADGTDDCMAPKDEGAGDGASVPHGPIAPPDAPAGAGGMGAGPTVAAVAAEADGDAPRLRRNGVPVRVGVLQRERNLERLAECLELGNNHVVTVADGKYLTRGAVPRPGGEWRQILRESQSYLGAPWLDWIEYRSAHGVRRVGRARVVVTGNEKRPVRLLVVERARSVAAVPSCPFSAYRCTRLRFDVRDVGVTPVLECVPVSRVLRVLCVGHDWVDWVGRHGLGNMPSAVLTTREEVGCARIFTNAFVNV